MRFIARFSCRVAALALAIGLVTLTAAQAGISNPGVGLGSGSNGNPGVLPIGSNPFGRSYGEWGNAWWQWAFSIPVSSNPLFDLTGANAAVGQSGHVWFLGGVFNISGTAVRTCTIPAGTALFFPIVNNECSTAEGNGTTEAELRACSEGPGPLPPPPPPNTTAELDGRAIANMQDYWVGGAPLYTIGPLPDDNLFQAFGIDAPAGSTTLSVQSGFFLMLAPLSAGAHTLHFHAGDGTGFTLDITYNLTVQPGGRGRGQIASAPGAVEHTTWGMLKEIYRK